MIMQNDFAIKTVLEKPLMAEKPIKEVLQINPEHEEARDLLRHCA